MLPTNPTILVSSINMWLRDGEFDSLDDLCAYHDQDKDELLTILSEAGYTYFESIQQFC